MNRNSFLVALVVALLASSGTYFYMKKFKCDGVSEKSCLLRRTMAKLWSDHVFWTRLCIIATLDNTADKDETTSRLLKNQQDIGTAVGSFYGAEAGQQVAQLLKDHILIAAQVIDAAKNNDTDKLKAEDSKWHKNADDIAQFLAKANPKNWQEKEMRDMLYHHLKLTTQEVVLRLKKDWAADIKNFDSIYDQALAMGLGLADGIIAQFPNKF